MKKFFLIPLACGVLSFQATANSVSSYIARNASIAKKEMIRTGVPASITLSQAIIESCCGTSHLAKRAHNYFGVKKRNGRYKVYENATQSFIDHSEILKRNKCYTALFKLSHTDFKGWAKGLAKAGYAKNHRYAQELIVCIQRYHLSRFDNQVIHDL